LDINGWKSNIIDRDPEEAEIRQKNTEKCCSSGAEENSSSRKSSLRLFHPLR
jgi:hypothetical protein